MWRNYHTSLKRSMTKETLYKSNKTPTQTQSQEEVTESLVFAQQTRTC